MSTAALWFSVLVGPLVWLAALEIALALTAWPCVPRRTAVLITVAAALLIALAGTFTGRRARARATGTDLASERARFLATLGTWISLLFALAIVTASVPALVLG